MVFCEIIPPERERDFLNLVGDATVSCNTKEKNFKRSFGDLLLSE